MTAAEFEALRRIEIELAGLRQAFVDHCGSHEKQERRRATWPSWISAAVAFTALMVSLLHRM